MFCAINRLNGSDAIERIGLLVLIALRLEFGIFDIGHFQGFFDFLIFGDLWLEILGTCGGTVVVLIIPSRWKMSTGFS